MATPSMAEITAELQASLQAQLAESKGFSILLVGRTGVGKSSTVNSLLGSKVAPVGDYEPMTVKVESYPIRVNGVDLLLIDTPGLCDALPEEGKDHDYLRRISENVTRVDSLWFLSPLNDTRVRADEVRAIRLLTTAFGKTVWQHAIIVLTFAGSISEARYAEALQMRAKLLRREIAACTSSEVADKIPAVPAENTTPRTPDGETWLNKLYVQLFLTMSARGFMSFFMATAPMIKLPPEAFSRGFSIPPIPQPAPAPPAPTVHYHQVLVTNESHIQIDPRDVPVMERRVSDIIGESYRRGRDAGGRIAGAPGRAVGGLLGGLWGCIKAIGSRL